MKHRALLSAIALCFAAVGCDSQKAAEPPKPKAAAAVVPLPPEAPKANAASANQDARPVQVADTKKAGAATANRVVRPGTKGCGTDKCKVNIKDITPGKPYCTATYNAQDLDVAGQGVTITFHATGGWTFDNNGIDLPAGGGQFSGQQGAGTNKYSVVDKNDDDKKYKYYIRLVKGNDKCVLDPSIANGAETIDPNYPPFP